MKVAAKSFIKFTAVTCFLIGASVANVQAQSSDVQTLLDRLNRLEADLTNVQRKVFQGQNVPAPQTLSAPGAQISEGSGAAVVLSSRLDTLEQEQRRLTGNYEELNFRIDQIKTRLDKLILDIDYRLTEIETRLNGGAQPLAQNSQGVSQSTAAENGASDTALAAPQSQPNETLPQGSQVLGTLRVDQNGNPIAAPATAATPNAVAAPTESTNPADQYNNAISMIRRDDYAGAEVAFASFIEQNPQHALAGNAQYWLGETFYVREDYPNAASAFLKGYQDYPNSGKAADNLLKLAMTLGRMDQKVEACATFGQLDKQFSNLPARLKRISEREKSQLACQ
ncbi:MAG: tol-pal system protein YbgF [Sneathiella sp.]|nr:tol-pal system protein YbgF [Sneathiella sp.]